MFHLIFSYYPNYSAFSELRVMRVKKICPYKYIQTFTQTHIQVYIQPTTTRNPQFFPFHHSCIMVVIKELSLSSHILIPAQPLTPKSFAKFGYVFSADEQIRTAKTSNANQGTAVKLLKVAPVVNNSSHAPSGKLATANWNIFRCTPPKKYIVQKEHDQQVYTGRVLERHPYSTQTFVPMGRDAGEKAFVVICAPNDPNFDDLPLVEKAEAFVCRGDQSVTYAAGTWHAPMVAIGSKGHLDFAVLVHENGVPNEDCQEVVYSPGFEVSFSYS